MIVTSLAAAALTLVLGAGEKPATSVAQLFKDYCKINADSGQSYCHDDVSDNVKWLVLYSLCTADPKNTQPTFDAVCDPFPSMVVWREEKNQRRFLAYNPRTDKWDGISYDTVKDKDGKCVRGATDAKGWYCRSTGGQWLDIDETGLATITRAASDDIPVIIVGTNPLLYGTAPETVTSDSIASLEMIQQIAIGLGGTLQAAARVSEALRSSRDAAWIGEGGMAPGKQPAADDAARIALSELFLLQQQTVERMASASRELGVTTGALSVARSQAIVLIQEVEQKVTRPTVGLTVPIQRIDSGAPAYDAVQKAYDSLGIAYRDVRDFGGSCRFLLSDFLFILRHATEPDRVVRSQIQQYLDRHSTQAECTGKFAPVASKIDDRAHELLRTGDAQTLATLLKTTGELYTDRLAVIVAPPPKPNPTDDKEPEPLAQALTLLTTDRNSALEAHTSVVAAASRRDDYAFGDTTLMTWLYATPKSNELLWDTLQTHTFSIKPSAPLANAVTASHEETELKYKLQSNKTAGLGVGFGVIYTRLSTPTFDAVTDPDNKDQKVVSQTGSTTLAGQLALLADWRALSAYRASAERWIVRPSLQIGTNVSTTPGFFVGAGVDVLKYFRFGVGKTWQQSSMLDPSQTPDKTVVTDKSGIKTRDIFASDWYYSFSFALDSLPLFKKGDAAAGSNTKDSAKAGDAGAAEGNEAPGKTAKGKTKTGS